MNIYRLGTVPEELYDSIGGKAKGLDMLVRQGFDVPSGFVITDTENIDDAAVYAAFDALNVPQVSVRSSASNEDQSGVSNAGQYETYLFVNRENLIECIRQCVQSLHAERVTEYARHFDLSSAKMNIVVQQMIDSDYAGVLFTADPNNGSNILIEAVCGQGENLVSGQVSAHRYSISRKNYRPCSDDMLSTEQVRLLYDTAKQIRTAFGEEKDIEWAIHAGRLYLLQMRPITTEIIDIEEFDRDEDLSKHLFTKRNVGEMMPGAVPPLTLSTSAKAIDYGMRYMLAKAGVYPSPEAEQPLRLISSVSGHLFFDMNLLYNMYARVGIANPQSMNLSIMGEYHDYPPIEQPFANPLVRVVNSVKFMCYVLSGHRAMKRFDQLLTRVHFADTSSYEELYRSIDANIPLLNESLIYHYASSSYSGSASSTLYQVLDPYFPDKKEYQAFLSHLLSNIPNIESADILSSLQQIACLISERLPRAKQMSADELLEVVHTDPQINQLYSAFLKRHGHRCIKEAEMRNKPWRDNEEPLMNYLRSIIQSSMTLSQGDQQVDLQQAFAFIRRPLLRRVSIAFARRARQAVVDREYTKSRLIDIIDRFKTQYARLAEMLVEAGLLDDADQIYFLTHEEIGQLIAGGQRLSSVAVRRRKAYAIQEELSFDDIYVGKPIANRYDDTPSDEKLRGVPVSNGLCEGVVRVVYTADDANLLQKGEIMVARFTDIGWTPYYSVVNGLITEIGSSLSHGAVVAREYGLPAIVNVKGATKLLKNGDRISMDASKGIVTIVA